MNIINRFTWRTLKLNRMRTIVTIIGIILSTAMFTAITTSIYSFQQYLINVVLETEGKWEGYVSNLTEEQVAEIRKNSDIVDSSVVKDVGTAFNEKKISDDAPYLLVKSLDKKSKEFKGFKLIKGRMPKNENELIVSEQIYQSSKETYSTNKNITLNVGERYFDGEKYISTKADAVVDKDGKLVETLKNTKEIPYKIVGIYSENYSDDYNVYTMNAEGTSGFASIYFTVKNPIEINKTLTQIVKKYHLKNKVEKDVHSLLLQYRGESPNQDFMAVLRNMGAILCAIIMIASISLIYNAFSISLSERTKQFGLLKSIGATKKQMRGSVLFEALVLSGIGIPLGIIIGLVGIGITLFVVGNIFDEVLIGEISTQLSIKISPIYIIVAGLIAIVTVLISAMLPAIRAIKMPAIQALRQTNDIKLKGKKLRVPKLVGKLFGVEGTLAYKNIKRNKRKSRTTILSLILSVVLFISTSAFTNYMNDTVSFLKRNVDFDIFFNLGEDDVKNAKISDDKIIDGITKISNIEEIGYSTVISSNAFIPFDYLDKEYLEFMKKTYPDMVNKDEKKLCQQIAVIALDDNTYYNFLKKKHFDKNTTKGLMWTMIRGKDKDGNNRMFNILKSDKTIDSIYFCNKIKGYDYPSILSYNKKNEVTYYNQKNGDEKNFAFDKVLNQYKIQDISQTSGVIPLGCEDYSWGGYISIIYPKSAISSVIEKWADRDYSFGINAKKHKQVVEKITDYLSENQIGKTHSVYIEDVQEEISATSNLILVVNIFSYGFIILISLIVVANVFNTISTNIRLRRQEFAMLKSVGMTMRGFDRMMNLECAIYGLKGIVWGLPISFGLCYLMYKSLQSAWNVPFAMPWISVVIAVVCVFLFVFVSMIYAMRKIKKDDVIEALRGENL